MKGMNFWLNFCIIKKCQKLYQNVNNNVGKIFEVDMKNKMPILIFKINSWSSQLLELHSEIFVDEIVSGIGFKTKVEGEGGCR